MPAGDWYYCDAERNSETVHGPVSPARLGELIRSGGLPYDVLVSTEPTPGATWVKADTLQVFLEAIPLDRERLVQE